MCRYWDLVWSAPGVKGGFDVYAYTILFCYSLNESFDTITPMTLGFTIKMGVSEWFLSHTSCQIPSSFLNCSIGNPINSVFA